MKSGDLSEDDLVAVIGLLWSEISLTNEKNTLDRLRREGLYETWEAALDTQMTNG